MSGSIEEAILAAVRAVVAPLAEELRQTRAAVEALREALPPALLDVHAAAEQLGVSESTIRRQIREGVLPVRRVGRSVRVDVSAMKPISEEHVAALAREARRG